ncbi:hypothetical protein VTK73DRAFT_1314 [Phialemonium thermophilum]|uniref:Uncharacterized protein n=1 Tax=Phialemonium thermophilum TaxID=223376 RepID=A0ABR3VTM7_9PEZI
MDDQEKAAESHVEVASQTSPDPDLVKPPAERDDKFDGDVDLAGPGDAIYLIPTPSPDPRDPLNLPLYRKLVVLAIVASFSAVGLTMVSGLGALLGLFIPGYVAEGRTVDDITRGQPL